jgi:hypothetical protein
VRCVDLGRSVGDSRKFLSKALRCCLKVCLCRDFLVNGFLVLLVLLAPQALEAVYLSHLLIDDVHSVGE